jgi:1-deoxy-D-xylulose-5-phosphate reductoisomerase
VRARAPRADRLGRGALDFTTLGSLEVERVDALRFPCVALAREAIRRGGTAPAALNAANEIAVESFLEGRLAFTAIAEVIEAVLGEVAVEELVSLEQVYAADIEARALARRFVSRRSPARAEAAG